MIRNDLIEKLQNEDLDKIFLQHRDIDQGNYRVARIDDNVVCWNPETGMIMDYFYDDQIEKEWFNINLIVPEMDTLNTFEMNRDGVIRKLNHKTGTVSIKKIIYDVEYPQYSIPLDSNKKEKRLTIHRMISFMFIPNDDPEGKPFVDHKDRNTMNYSLTNLRWVSTKENNENKGQSKFCGNFLYEAYEDSEFKNLKFTLTGEEILNSEYDSRTIRSVTVGYDKDRRMSKYRGLYWKTRNLDIENYLNEGETIDDSKWILHHSGKAYIHPLGIVKIASRPGIVTIGHVKHGYRSTYITGIGVCCIHRLVAEVFLNENSPLSRELHIDHIDANRQNNRVENLRICTRVENMNNPLTRERLAKKVLAEGVIYNSISECAKHYGVTRQDITFRVNSKYQKDFSFVTDN